MDLIVYLIFFVIFGSGVVYLNYFRKLVSSDRDTFKKDEIVNFKEILFFELKHVIFKEKNFQVYIVFFSGVFAAYIFCIMGGIYGAYYESIFFNSAILTVGLYYLIPVIKANNNLNIEDTILYSFLQFSDHLFLGFSFSTAIQIITAWGMYNAISFFWVLINLFALFTLIIVTLSRIEFGEYSFMDLFKKKSSIKTYDKKK